MPPIKAAAAAVFQTAELLEKILSESDFHQLLAARNVCHHWRNVIAASSPLRKALFLQAASLQEVMDLQISKHERGYPVIWYNSRMCEVREGQDEGSLPSLALLNPAFFNLKGSAHPTVNMQKLLKGRENGGVVNNMLITQPPAKRILFIVCLGVKKQQGSKRDDARRKSVTVEMMAGGRQASDVMSLLARMDGIEEQAMEYYGREVAWSLSNVQLEGNSFRRGCLDKWLG